MQQPELVQLAGVLDEVDYVLGLRGNYTELLPRPEDVIFSVTYTKAASDYGQLCELQTGSVYEKAQLAKLAREELISLFGEDFAKEACTGLEVDPEKIAALAHTLPRADAELLEHLLTVAGQHPQRAKAAGCGTLNGQTLEDLVKRYS